MSREDSSAPQDASDIYDRQIRLWGAEAQSKISSAKVLYIHITGVTSEILKNLVLAGVQPAICDGRPYPDAVASTPCSFLSPEERIVPCSTTSASSSEQDDEKKDEDGTRKCKKRRVATVAAAMKPLVHELNPLLQECPIEERDVKDVPDDYFAGYDVVIASRIDSREAIRIASATTKAGGKFILADCFGLMGCAVLDLGPKHVFRREVGKDKLSEPQRVTPYVPFGDVMTTKLADMKKSRWDKQPPKIWGIYRAYHNYLEETGAWPTAPMAKDFADRSLMWLKDMQESSGSGGQQVPDDLMGEELELKSLAAQATAEMSPVCAVLGGMIGNEVIKALSGKGEPANNVLLFDGNDGGCRSFVVHSIS